MVARKLKVKELTDKKRSQSKSSQMTRAKLREMKSSWWEKKTRALKAAVDSHDAKTFFNELKAVYGLQSRGTSPIIFISQHFNKLERKLRKRTICDIPGDSNSKAGYVNHV